MPVEDLRPEQVRLLEKLREQLRFSERSCIMFDQGDEAEALRLATCLRNIFHDKSRTVSLVSHLELGDSRMLSSWRGHGDWKDYLSHEINLASPTPVRMRPLLGDRFQNISLNQWWKHQPVFVYAGEKYSRRIITLSAAEKDGGAHVDAKLEKYYEVLCSGEYAIGITGNLTYAGAAPFEQGVTHFPKNAHLALIRQFAHETLASAKHFNWLKHESLTSNA